MPGQLPALLAITLLVLAVIAAVMLLRWRLAAARAAAGEAAERAERAERQLSGAPFGCLTVGEGASPALCGLLGLPETSRADLDAVCRRFREADGERLRTEIDRLRDEGEAFALTLETAEGERWLEARGCPSGHPVVWFAEVSEHEAARRRAEARAQVLGGLLDSLPLPVWQRDDELRLRDCNEAHARAVVHPREAVLADGVELLGERGRPQAEALARRALETGEPQSEEHHVVVEGARCLLAVTEVPLAGGGLAGYALDRTEAEELRAELARHTSAHADVLENLGSAIAIYGPDLRLRFYNSAYVELWGLDEAFLDGEPRMEELLEALRERRRLPEQPDFRAYKSAEVEKFRNLVQQEEELLHRPDGTTLRMTSSPHPFGGVLFTFEDVTDRLALERRYNTLIAVQRETIDNLYEAVAVFGADGRLTLWNNAYARLWHVPPERLDDRPHLREIMPLVRDLFDVAEEDWPALTERMVGQATEPLTRSGRMERPDGAVIDWAQVPLPDGQSLFTYFDVTDSTRVERALRERNEALETADRLKSEFIANVSYELRTPLNAIVGFAEILENQFFGTLNERQHEYAEAIVQSSHRLMHLINDILDLATIEAGYMSLERTPVEVRPMLESVRSLVHERAHSRGIELQLDCSGDVGALAADERRLKQALFNLLTNAFNFTPEGGRVTLGARRAHSELQLLVSDTGVGIPQEEQARVFDKFDRGGAAGRGGAGLGLALVKNLVELHGGWVELDSAPEAGTCVTCHLPLEAPQEAAGPGSAAPRAEGDAAAAGGAG